MKKKIYLAVFLFLLPAALSARAASPLCGPRNDASFYSAGAAAALPYYKKSFRKIFEGKKHAVDVNAYDEVPDSVFFKNCAPLVAENGLLKPDKTLRRRRTERARQVFSAWLDTGKVLKPKRAFKGMTRADIFWAAKTLMFLTEEELRAADPQGTLSGRRALIARSAFLKSSPLDRFRLENG